MGSSKKGDRPARLKYVGGEDVWVDGVPRGDLEIVAEPVAHNQVSPERAQGLIATGLYMLADDQDQNKPSEQPAKEDVSNG